jgi:hypothetical protein
MQGYCGACHPREAPGVLLLLGEAHAHAASSWARAACVCSSVRLLLLLLLLRVLCYSTADAAFSSQLPPGHVALIMLQQGVLR